MRTRFLPTGIFLLSLSACCTKQDCPSIYNSAAFTGFTAAELDTVCVLIAEPNGARPPDTFYTSADYYPPGRDTASLIGTLPFNPGNSYTYYLPATGMSYRVDGFEVSYTSCNSCFPKSAETEDYEILQAYRINGLRHDGQFVVIRK